MDVNGTRFHLLLGEADWTTAREARADGTVAPFPWQDATYDRERFAVTLRPSLSLFKSRAGTGSVLRPEDRRGADRDRFGNVYWIGHDGKSIWWQPEGDDCPAVWWDQSPATCPAEEGAFAPSEPPPAPAALIGLAVTEDHYLVVGNRDAGGVFLFDLHAGGPPHLLLWPGGPTVFAPFDLTAAPGGGVWVLDRTHRKFWGIDRRFRVFGAPLAGSGPAFTPASVFTPEDGTPGNAPPALTTFPDGFALAAADPVAIAALTDGTVLILDSPGLSIPGPNSPASRLLRYKLGALQDGPCSLAIADIEVTQEGGELLASPFYLVGYDLAVSEAEGAVRLFVVERDGNQVIALRAQWDKNPPLSTEADFLPLYYFGGRAVISAGVKPLYDVVGGGDITRDDRVRWMPLETIEQPRYERQATLLVGPLDGRDRGTVWHRLLLDACIPPGASVEVSTRAHDDLSLLDAVPWRPEPELYRRPVGAELPYYDPYPRRTIFDPEIGVWELLFQAAKGRYAEIRLDLYGTGRVTPHLQALRAWYPRFSYPRRFLPKVYQDDAASADFLERMLANPEGINTEIEGRIVDVPMLFDPRSTPPEALDWLAGWVGLVLDPLWSELQKRRSDTAPEPGPVPPWIPPPDRRRLFVRYARALFDRRGTLNGVRFALMLLLEPCLEIMLEGLKRAAVDADSPWHTRLARYGVPSPTPATGDAELEDLLLNYLLAPTRPSKTRLVERFLTRGGRAMEAGDPTDDGTTGGAFILTTDTIAAEAHRFSVLVPDVLSEEEERMVRRVVELEKPAHTAFDVRRYWDYFRVGEARIGLDTVLGESSRFTPILLGTSAVPGGYLAPTPPFDVLTRVVANRDRIGQMPAL